MKRLGSSDSLGGLMTICPTTDERSPGNSHMYSRDQYQSMLNGLDEEGCVEESGHIGEKKRRLSITQVKALEKNFELENKLEPERKVKLAQELGLQPRQVAVWFQNRRARWKTKQLERDYGVLKASYDALKLNFDTLQLDNDALRKEIRELKSKLEENNAESDISVKEEVTHQDSEDKVAEPSNPTSENPILKSESKELNHDFFHGSCGVGVSSVFATDFKDGASDSDSSAILNEDNSPNATMSSYGVLQSHQRPVSPSPLYPVNCFQLHKVYQPQFVKVEEHNFFGGDDACDFFSEEQAPTLHWDCSDQWN